MDLSFSFNQLNKSFYQTYSLVNFSEREVYQSLVEEFQKKNSPLVIDFKLLFKNIYKYIAIQVNYIQILQDFSVKPYILLKKKINF